MTKYEIAKELGVSNQAVYAWYNGKKLPSTKNILKLSILLNIPIEKLIEQFVEYKKEAIKRYKQ